MLNYVAKRGWQWVCLSLFLILISAFCASVSAQTTSTTILGTVTDPTGAVLPGVKLTVINTKTGVKREDVTSSTGDFSFPLLDVGVYDLIVDAKGFKQEVRRNIVLEINEKVRADFTLQVGTTDERVEVTAEAATLRTDDATLGQTVEQRRVEELPLNNRNLGALAILQPGVQYGPRSGTDGQGIGQRQGGHGIPIPGIGLSFVANGQRETNEHGTLDGVVATEARVNTIPFSPSVEAVQEFRVLSGSYSAEYGFNAGAQIIIVTKSGTNEWHGSAFEFLRNDIFDAENFFQNYFPSPLGHLDKDSLRQNNFGGVLTGPLSLPKIYNGHNRTFFMVNYEARRRRDGRLARTANHPPLAFRRGDFSSLLSLPTPIIIIDPLSPTGAPFPGNIIPDARISPVAKELMKFWPEPQQVTPNPLNGFDFVGFERRTVDDDQLFGRVDHNFSEKDKIFGRYAFNDVNYSVIPGDNPNFSYFVNGRNHNVAGGWIHIFNPSFINELRYGFNRSVDDTLNPRANTDFDVEALGLTGFRVVNDGNRKFTSRETGVPTVVVDRFSSLSEQDGGNGFDFNNLHQISDNVTISHGVHNMKVGFDFRRVSLFRGAANLPRGRITFGGNLAGTAFAAFLLGLPSNVETPEGLPLTDIRQNRFAFYFTDDWKVSRKLTLNLGVRYEYNSAATDIRGLWRSLRLDNLTNGLPTLMPVIGEEFNFYDPQNTILMPRLGLAYRATDNWVFRAGAGIYYNVHQLNNYSILNLNPPKSGTTNFANGASGGRITNPPGSPIFTFTAPFGTVNPTSPTGLIALNPDNHQPYVTQWSLDVQRRLPSDIVLTVGYVGNKGTHIDNSVQINAPSPAVTATPNLLRPIQAFADGPNGPRRTLNSLRWLDSNANSWYHALQVNAQKRFSGGLQLTLAYTYGKAMGEGYGRNESDGATQNTYQDPRNRAAEKTRYGFDFRQSAVVSFLYELPAPGSLGQGVAKYFFGGWQTNGIVRLLTGRPFTVSQNNTINTLDTPVRPDLLGSAKLDNPTVNKWYDPDAFRVVTCQQPNSVAAVNDYLRQFCHYGSAGQGILEGPGFKNVDFSLLKTITIKENWRLQFRAEIFNLFNTPQFGLPISGLNGNFLPTTVGGAFPTQAGQFPGPGVINSLAAPMRQMQFGLKLLF